MTQEMTINQPKTYIVISPPKKGQESQRVHIYFPAYIKLDPKCDYPPRKAAFVKNFIQPKFRQFYTTHEGSVGDLLSFICYSKGDIHKPIHTFKPYTLK